MTRRAVLFPGGGYGPHVGLLFYAAAAVESRNATVHRVTWPSFPPEVRGPGNHQGVIDPVVAAELDGDVSLVVGKSLGTRAAHQVAARGLPAIWLTPLLREPDVVADLRNATAPFALIGGTADHRHWDGALARELTPYVLEIPEANHGLMVPGPVSASTAMLGQVCDAIEDFLDRRVWP